MPDVVVQGARLSYDVAGPEDGTVLLLSHALGTSRELFDDQLSAFTDRFRVIRHDIRGHGKSGSPAGEYAIAELGSDVLRILDDAGVERAHVVGVSLGGLTTLWLAIHAPARIGNIVLANTAGRIGSRAHWQARIDQVRANGFPAIAAAAPARWFTPGFVTSRPETVAAYQAMLNACDPDGYNGCCAALRDADVRPDLSRIAAPALVVTGISDPVCPVADAVYLRDHIPGARYLELDAAHYSNVERASEFTKATSEFLGG